MSISFLSKNEDKIYAIESFMAKTAYDSDGFFDSENCIEVSTGETVIYVDWFIGSTGDNDITMIQYRRENDEELLAAIESYFVTEEVWLNLEKFFYEQFQKHKGSFI